MTKIKQSSSPEEKATLKAVRGALRPFKDLREKTMPLHYATAFIEVALEEGQTVSEYAKRAGVDQSLMSRYLADMGKVNRYHEEGLGLVEQFHNMMDRRQQLIRLTAKGRTFVYQMTQGE